MSLSSFDSFTSSSGTPSQAANGYQHLHRVMAEMRANDVKVTVPDLLVLVVDPFAGSGTTGHAALALGRRAALFDLNGASECWPRKNAP